MYRPLYSSNKLNKPFHRLTPCVCLHRGSDVTYTMLNQEELLYRNFYTPHVVHTTAAAAVQHYGMLIKVVITKIAGFVRTKERFSSQFACNGFSSFPNTRMRRMVLNNE